MYFVIFQFHCGKLDNLWKVSISPWCDENFMAERLVNKDIIYYRKPSPLFIRQAEFFDESGFEEHIKNTLFITKGCKLEFSFRDIYTLKNDKK